MRETTVFAAAQGFSCPDLTEHPISEPRNHAYAAFPQRPQTLLLGKMSSLALPTYGQPAVIPQRFPPRSVPLLTCGLASPPLLFPNTLLR